MNSAPDDFEALRKLLAWKRHEQPPPGYFRAFPGRVMARLEVGEIAAAVPWWQRLLASFDLKPAVGTAFGLAVIGIYFFGLSLADRVGQQSQQAALPAIPWHDSSPLPAPHPVAQLAHQPLANPTEPMMASSMNPLISAGAPPGLFKPGAALRGYDVQRTGFSVRGN